MSVRAMSSVLRIQKTQLIRLMIQNGVWVILAGVMKAVKANWYLYVVAVAKVYKSNQSMQYSKLATHLYIVSKQHTLSSRSSDYGANTSLQSNYAFAGQKTSALFNRVSVAARPC